MFSTLLAHQYQGAGFAQAASEKTEIKAATAIFEEVSNSVSIRCIEGEKSTCQVLTTNVLCL